jgi:hypothetical protein
MSAVDCMDYFDRLILPNAYATRNRIHPSLWIVDVLIAYTQRVKSRSVTHPIVFLYDAPVNIFHSFLFLTQLYLRINCIELEDLSSRQP